FRKLSLAQRQRRGIVAPVVVNKIVDGMGERHSVGLAGEEGAGLGRIHAAFGGSCLLFGLRAPWRASDEAPMPETGRVLLSERAARALRAHRADLPRAGGVVGSASRLVDEASPGDAEHVDHVDDLLAEEARGHAESFVSKLLEAGAPPKIAPMAANLFAVDGA